jgi:hypothetical protein
MTQHSYYSFHHWKWVACMYLDKMPTLQQDTFVHPHGGQDDSMMSAKLIRIAPENSSF